VSAAACTEVTTVDNAVTVTSHTITVAETINEEHRLARCAAESAVQHAIRCGELLHDQKEHHIARGEFDAWIAKNCTFKRATAYSYIKLYKLSSSDALDDSDAGEHVVLAAIRHLFPSGRQPIVPKKRITTTALVLPAHVEEGGHDDDVADGDAGQLSESAVELRASASMMTVDEALTVLRQNAIEGDGTFTTLVSRVQSRRAQVTKLRNKLQQAEKALSETEARAIEAAMQSRAAQQ
jgi:hypothetical protein